MGATVRQRGERTWDVVIADPPGWGKVKEELKKALRQLQVWRITGPGADHPVPLDFPEGRYLTVVWARVS